MEEQERIQAAKAIHEKARYYRGRFLNSVACIEHDIAHILTEYFCTDDPVKRRIFYDGVVKRFTLNKKKNILIRILQEDFPYYWKDNQGVFSTFQEILEFRNQLAHSVVDVSDGALARPIEQGIGFTDWSDGQPITKVEFDDWDAKANTIYSRLKDIKRLLPYKQINKKGDK